MRGDRLRIFRGRGRGTPQPEPRVAPPGEGIVRSAAHILLVEDEPDVGVLLREILTDHG